MRSKVRRIIICIVSVILLVIIDQATKFWAVSNLKDKDSIWIIKNALQLYYLPNGNSGAAWGMLEGQQGLFIAIAIVVIAGIGYLIFNMPEGRKYNVLTTMLVFIAAGGIGNMYDRIAQSYVVDFIYFSLINFPIFNVADIYVSVCTVILALYLIFAVSEDELKEFEAAMKKPFSKKKEQ